MLQIHFASWKSKWCDESCDFCCHKKHSQFPMIWTHSKQRNMVYIVKQSICVFHSMSPKQNQMPLWPPMKMHMVSKCLCGHPSKCTRQTKALVATHVHEPGQHVQMSEASFFLLAVKAQAMEQFLPTPPSNRIERVFDTRRYRVLVWTNGWQTWFLGHNLQPCWSQTKHFLSSAFFH